MSQQPSSSKVNPDLRVLNNTEETEDNFHSRMSRRATAYRIQNPVITMKEKCADRVRRYCMHSCLYCANAEKVGLSLLMDAETRLWEKSPAYQVSPNTMLS